MLLPGGWAASSLSLPLPVTSAVCTDPLNPPHGPAWEVNVCVCACAHAGVPRGNSPNREGWTGVSPGS